MAQARLHGGRVVLSVFRIRVFPGACRGVSDSSDEDRKGVRRSDDRATALRIEGWLRRVCMEFSVGRVVLSVFRIRVFPGACRRVSDSSDGRLRQYDMVTSKCHAFLNWASSLQLFLLFKTMTMLNRRFTQRYALEGFTTNFIKSY